MARCNNGAVATRTWTVPASTDSGGSQTYYFCFSKYTAKTNFKFNGRLGQVNSAVLDETSFDAYLLSKIILPNNTSYSFQYDPDYLDLTRIDLPTGGVIVYTWGTVKWDLCSTALPMKRVVTSRSVTTGGGVSSWSYNWGNGGVCNPQPGDTIPVIVSRPDQNDEWHHQTRMEDNGKLNKYVVFYKGHAGGDAYNATGTISKIVKTSSSFRQTPLFTQTQDILVSPETGPDGPIVKWLQGYSTPETIPGPVEKTVVTLYNTTTQAVASSQETDATPVPSSGTIARWNPDNYWYPAHDTCACVNYSEIATEKVYDFVQGSGSGPGTLLRETDITYRFQDTGGGDYENNGLTGLPSQVKVYDGASHEVAQSGYTYDESAYSAGVVAGELTSVRKWKDASNYYDSHSSFNSDGTWTGSIDANGIQTHVNSFDCLSAFPKSVTKAYGTSIAETFVYSHDCDTGKVTSYKDANSQTTSYTYADSLSRVTAVDYPDGGHTAISYTDGANSSTTVDVDTGGSQGKMSQTVKYDLVGRTIKVQQNADSVISVDTNYDAMGHVYSTSNPYTSTQGSSSDVTANAYDELERIIQKTNPDSSSQTFSYSGNVVTSTDEAGNAWKRTSDALGRLTKVVEPNNATTNYTYSARGDLTSVQQVGVSGDVARTNRSFDYDWLSRLKQAYNPESGWICYGTISSATAPNGSNCSADYDGNGNLGHKTDARGVQTNYFYDALNRLTRKEYTDGTPWAYFYYDQTSTWAGTPSNGIGRLTETLVGAVHRTDRVFSYDAMGRVTDIGEELPSDLNLPGHGIHYRYDLAGNPVTIGYPSGRVVTQSFDAAGRLKSAAMTGWAANALNFNSFSPTNVDFPYTYVQGDCSSSTSICYTPAGAVSSWKVGNAGQSFTYNNRLQTTRIQAFGFSQNLMDRQYSFAPSTTGSCMTAGNNGNIWSIVDGLNAYHTQTFQYDCLSRMTYASRSDGAFTTNFSIDSFGNSSPSVNGTATMTFGSDNRVNNLPCAATLTAFDAAGNQLCDGLAAWGTLHQYSYDAESRVSQINSGSTSVAAYQYDTEGNRVHKDAGGDWIEYVYMNGQPLSEKRSDGSWSDYIYANGKKVAKADTFENEIQVGGTFDHNGVSWIGMTLPISIPGGTNPNTGQPYAVIRPGDRLVWQQEQFNARGGMCLFDSNGNSTSWALHALDGDLTNSWHDTSGAWITRVVPLDSWAGHTLTGACVVADGETNSITNGSPSIVLVNDAAILRADGSVLPIYQSGQGQPGWQIWQGVQSGNAITNNFWNIRNLQGFNTATYPSVSTTHYLADHLGSTSMALTVEGWPTQTSEFQPYGQEINPVASANHYKFTGKERDTESGLDYFGARYYGSTMGRFMSPDWSVKAEPVPYAKLDNPQSLNLYAYVGSNPMSAVDPTGHSPGIFNPLNYTLLMAGEVENWQQQLQNDMQNANAAQQQIGQDPTLPAAVDPTAHNFVDRLMTVLFPRSWGDMASLALAVPTDGLGEVGAAFLRAKELSNAMGKTADFVTIAVTETKEGTRVVSSSEKALRPAVQALLKDGEVAAKGAGHAEITGVNAAKQIGLTPTGVAASRGICPACADYLRGAGIAALSVLKSMF